MDGTRLDCFVAALLAMTGWWAIGKTEDPADAVKAGTIQKMVKRLNPVLSHGDTGIEAARTWWREGVGFFSGGLWILGMDRILKGRKGKSFRVNNPQKKGVRT